MDRYKNKYRIPSIRLQAWDYRAAGLYFITICTYKKEYYFGEIRNRKMLLSSVGNIAKNLWYEIPDHVQNIKLDEFIIMPNHLHGILILKENDSKGEYKRCLSFKPWPGINRFQNIGHRSVSSIVGSYKSAVTKHVHRAGLDFMWQSGFHDHVIRNSNDFFKIQKYIVNNPLNWHDDKYNKENQRK